MQVACKFEQKPDQTSSREKFANFYKWMDIVTISRYIPTSLEDIFNALLTYKRPHTANTRNSFTHLSVHYGIYEKMPNTFNNNSFHDKFPPNLISSNQSTKSIKRQSLQLIRSKSIPFNQINALIWIIEQLSLIFKVNKVKNGSALLAG